MNENHSGEPSTARGIVSFLTILILTICFIHLTVRPTLAQDSGSKPSWLHTLDVKTINTGVVSRTTAFTEVPQLKSFCIEVINDSSVCRDLTLVYVTNESDLLGSGFEKKGSLFTPSPLMENALPEELRSFPIIVIPESDRSDVKDPTVVAHEYGHFLFSEKYDFIREEYLPPEVPTIDVLDVNELIRQEFEKKTSTSQRRNMTEEQITEMLVKLAEYFRQPEEEFAMLIGIKMYRRLNPKKSFEDYVCEIELPEAAIKILKSRGLYQDQRYCTISVPLFVLDLLQRFWKKANPAH